MKTILAILGISVMLISCEPSDNEKYQNLNNADYQFIPEQYQNIEKVFTFKNQQNDIVQIKSSYYNLTKEFESGYGFGQPTQTESYYYDNLWIGLELMDVDVSNQNGGGCNEVSIHINKVGNGRLLTKMIIPYYDGSFCLGNGFEEFSPFENLAEMEFNGVNYSKIKIIIPNDFFTFYEGSTIDKVYYDMDNGIVGFDDTVNDLEFRLINE
jgi:hypothetical protein